MARLPPLYTLHGLRTAAIRNLHQPPSRSPPIRVLSRNITSQTEKLKQHHNSISSAQKATTKTTTTTRHQHRATIPQHEIEIPSFSFEGLGATPGVKVVLYTALAVLATLETYFYGRWIYHYLYPESTPEATHYLKKVYRYVYPAQRPASDDEGGEIAAQHGGKSAT